MNHDVRRLFVELADVTREERLRILNERAVPEAVRNDLESLFAFDSRAKEPAVCGAYRLMRLLGTGGMGEVYLAERNDGEIEQRVAIKLLRPASDRPVFRERFLRERQLLSYLHHSSIARMLDAGHTGDGRPYLVMEYVEGARIDEYSAGLSMPGTLRLFLQVCDAVSHAHRHLIVHRDLKPSNILVNASGQPKLLDFGIAKLLDTDNDETRTVDRMLTPNYASPEQTRGDVQTTATDVYSLGAVLHRLLTGLPPCAAGDRLAGLPRDVEHILRKALREEPEHRYASVDAFAADILAYLESRPVAARAGDAFYRVRKFARRYRAPLIAASLVLVSLLAGIQIANYQRTLAQKRFKQVRQLANRVLELDQAAGGSHSSARARKEIVALSKEYLETLGEEARGDKDLALEVGEAYSLLARTQGVSVTANLGQHREAEASLRKARAFVQPVLEKEPNHRRALLTAARIHHDRMILAETERRRDQALLEAAKSVEYLDRLLARADVRDSEREAASEILYHAGLAYKNLDRGQDAIRFVRRSIDTARTMADGRQRMCIGWSLMADLLRITGDLEGALNAIRQARAELGQAHFTSEQSRRHALFTVLFREGRILGASSGMSLRRTAEAIQVLEKAFTLTEEWTLSDSEDAWSRLSLAPVGRELGMMLRDRNAARALDYYDRTLRRVAEVRDNTEARRVEVELLSGSAYALRRLGRVSEAKARLDDAFRIMGETGDYPADRITPHQQTDAAMRALADHYAETGELHRAQSIYRELLAKMTAANADPESDLRHAVAFSTLYTSMSALEGLAGLDSRSDSMLAARAALWRNWERKMPGNGYVRRELESAQLAMRR
ncbi:MAG: serine/threonine protein kinase [Bryobacterales bacterium]|nr:serine/threonine protein kinase [Bryobacterales bacterium]